MQSSCKSTTQQVRCEHWCLQCKCALDCFVLPIAGKKRTHLELLVVSYHGSTKASDMDKRKDARAFIQAVAQVANCLAIPALMVAIGTLTSLMEKEM